MMNEYKLQFGVFTIELRFDQIGEKSNVHSELLVVINTALFTVIITSKQKLYMKQSRPSFYSVKKPAMKGCR
jgi:hypothetical protein